MDSRFKACVSRRKSISSPASADSPSPQSGQDSKPSPSAKSTSIANGSSPKTSAQFFPTPTQDSASNRKGKYKQGGMPLTAAVKLFPSPMPSAATGGRTTKGKSRPNEDGLMF